MLQRVITNLYANALRPLDLKVSQMNILVAAAKMGTARPLEVCEYLHLDVSTLSRNVDRMKARGWLEVVPDEDGRRTCLSPLYAPSRHVFGPLTRRASPRRPTTGVSLVPSPLTVRMTPGLPRPAQPPLGDVNPALPGSRGPVTPPAPGARPGPGLARPYPRRR